LISRKDHSGKKDIILIVISESLVYRFSGDQITGISLHVLSFLFLLFFQVYFEENLSKKDFKLHQQITNNSYHQQLDHQQYCF